MKDYTTAVVLLKDYLLSFDIGKSNKKAFHLIDWNAPLRILL